MKKLTRLFGNHDLEFHPTEKIHPVSRQNLPQGIMASTSGITLNETLPGYTGAFVRFYHGDIKACKDMNHAVLPEVALKGSGRPIYKSLKTPENPNGVIANRSLGAILPHVPEDVFAFQIIRTESLKGAFLRKAQLIEKEDSQVFWLGLAEHIEDDLVLRTVNGHCVALAEDYDIVFNPFGVQVWPQSGVKAVVPAAVQSGPHLSRVK